MESAIQSRGVRISVVIPAYNEAQNLPHVLPMIPNYVSEVILVDGHSIDDTIEVAQRLVPKIKVIQQTGKGKGDAIRCGIAACTGDMIILMDADGSTDPREMGRFVDVLLAGADFAKGSRFIPGGGSDDLTILRKLGNRALHTFANFLFGVHFTDLCYGYNAMWRGCLDCFEVDCAGFEVETLISLRACKANLKIVEVPSYELPRIYGKSNLRTFEDGWRVLRRILKEWVNGQSAIKLTVMRCPDLRMRMTDDDLFIREQVGII